MRILKLKHGSFQLLNVSYIVSCLLIVSSCILEGSGSVHETSDANDAVASDSALYIRAYNLSTAGDTASLRKLIVRNPRLAVIESPVRRKNIAFAAAARGQYLVLRELFRQGFDVDKTDLSLRNVVDYSLLNKEACPCLTVVMLENPSFDLNASRPNLPNVYYLTSAMLDTSNLKCLIKLGADPNSYDGTGSSIFALLLSAGTAHQARVLSRIPQCKITGRLKSVPDGRSHRVSETISDIRSELEPRLVDHRESVRKRTQRILSDLSAIELEMSKRKAEN